MDNNIDSDNKNASNVNYEQQKPHSKKYVAYLLVFIILVAINFVIPRDEIAITVSVLFILLFFLILYLKRVVTRGKIPNRLTFYPTAIMIAIIAYFAVPPIIIGFWASKSQESVGLEAVIIYIAGLVLGVVLLFASAVFYEVTRYLVYKKDNTKLVDKTILADNKKNLGLVLFSLVVFFVSILFLYDYLKLFINNYRFVKMLPFVNNLKDYGLNNLSIKEIFTTTYVILIYIFVVTSILGTIKAFKNSKLVGVIQSISLLVFIILFISKISIGSHHEIYFNTVYQKGSPYNGGAIDIIRADEAIRAQDISLCSEVKYYAYRDYCKKMLTPLINNKIKK